jgi:hypothetical protein
MGKPPSQTWRTFLENHVKTMVSVDFFTVPTITFQVLYVFLVLAHDRRRVVHFNVTAHPTAEWTGQQLREAFPFDQIPRYLLRDRDGIFGREFRRDVEGMGIKEVLSTPRSPWERDHASYCTWSAAFEDSFFRSIYTCFGAPLLGRSLAGASYKHSPLSL